MYVYIPNNTGQFAVGFYVPSSCAFITESTHATADEAAARVNYLNGGPVPE